MQSSEQAKMPASHRMTDLCIHLGLKVSSSPWGPGGDGPILVVHAWPCMGAGGTVTSSLTTWLLHVPRDRKNASTRHTKTAKSRQVAAKNLTFIHLMFHSNMGSPMRSYLPASSWRRVLQISSVTGPYFPCRLRVRLIVETKQSYVRC